MKKILFFALISLINSCTFLESINPSEPDLEFSYKIWPQGLVELEIISGYNENLMIDFGDGKVVKATSKFDLNRYNRDGSYTIKIYDTKKTKRMITKGFRIDNTGGYFTVYNTNNPAVVGDMKIYINNVLTATGSNLYTGQTTNLGCGTTGTGVNNIFLKPGTYTYTFRWTNSQTIQSGTLEIVNRTCRIMRWS